MPDRDEEELISAFIHDYTQPVQWVFWWHESSDEATKERLGAVLFEPGGGSLRDLSSPAIREEVVQVVLGSRSLLRTVGEEVSRILDEATDRERRGTQRP